MIRPCTPPPPYPPPRLAILACVAIALGIVADVEGLAISAVLPRRARGVPSLARAWRLRRRG